MAKAATTTVVLITVLVRLPKFSKLILVLKFSYYLDLGLNINLYPKYRMVCIPFYSRIGRQLFSVDEWHCAMEEEYLKD